MRFCLELGHHSWKTGDARERVEQTLMLGRAADQAGFDSIWALEDPDGWDAFVVLAMLARETESVRLGPGVANPFLRHPNLIAASIATLDRISGGRAFLGLGRGQPEWSQAGLGVPVAHPLAAVEETVDLLEQWRRPPHRASSPGPIPVRDWTRTIHAIGPTPVYLAATGPKMQELAGRIADGVRFNALASCGYLAESIDRVRAAAVAAGRDPGALRFFFNPGIRITDSPERAISGLKSTIAMIHALPGMERQLQSAQFDIAAIMATVRAHMKTEAVLNRGGNFADLRRLGDLAAAKQAIPDELVRNVAIVGSEHEMGPRLKALTRLGITDVFLDVPKLPGGVAGLSELVERLRRMCET